VPLSSSSLALQVGKMMISNCTTRHHFFVVLLQTS
jgi:hypothetical protein